jgi:hypothetical protein
MDGDPPEKIRWDADFKRRVYGGVASGIIVLIIAAIAGVVVAQVASLSAPDALLYVGLPVLVVVLLTLAVVVIRAQRQRARQREEWEASISQLALELRNIVRRILLTDLIHCARVSDWAVGEDEDGDLLFVSPDEQVVVVEENYPHAGEVAERLHAASPEHFEEKWHDFTYRANVTADIAEIAADRLRAEMDEMGQRLAQAALTCVTPDAERAGWEAHWFDDRVIYSKGSDTATVYYDCIDPTRLRQSLGLDRDQDPARG